MARHVPLAQLRFAEFVRPGDVIGWPQGPGESLALTEALVAQGAELSRPTLFFGLSSSPTLHPELASHFAFRALNGAGTNRRISSLADIVPSHVSCLPGLLRSGALRIDVVLIQVRLMPDGRADMCDSCPDITILDGKLVNSCRMDEVRLFGSFVNVVEKTTQDDPARSN